MPINIRILHGGVWLVLALVASGCGQPPELTEAQTKRVNAVWSSDLRSIARRSGGDWNKLTPNEQAKFLERARGDVGGAKMVLSLMAGQPGMSAPGSASQRHTP